jgi:transposase-like protein
MTLQDLDRHLNEHHIETSIQWGCFKRGKSFSKLHGAKWHIPKCSDPTQCSKGQFKCDACPRSFASQRGLLTHERHAHLAVRNIKRRRTDPPLIVSSGRVRIAEEVTLLTELGSRNKKNKSNTKVKPQYNHKSAKNNKRDGGKKRASRYRGKRYACARCQEIFKESRKKLADVIVYNDMAYL